VLVTPSPKFQVQEVNVVLVLVKVAEENTHTVSGAVKDAARLLITALEVALSLQPLASVTTSFTGKVPTAG